MSIGKDILMRYKHIWNRTYNYRKTKNRQTNLVLYIASRLLDIGIVYFLAFDGVIETKEKHETWCNVFAYACLEE